MRARLAMLAVLLGGCNALLGLDPTQVGDDDVGGDGGIDGPSGPDARQGIPGLVFALSLDYTQNNTPVQGYSALAELGPQPRDCVRVAESEGCRMERCTPLTPQIPAPDSGTITIESDLRIVNLVPDGTGVYAGISGFDGRFFNTGITIGIYSTGAEVPAFSAAIVSPPQITFTTALPAGDETLTIERSRGLDLAWSPVDDGTVLVTIGDAASGIVTCELPATEGAGLVPPAVLTELEAGQGTFVGFTVNGDRVEAGDYSVSVAVAQVTRRSDGDWANGTVFLQ